MPDEELDKLIRDAAGQHHPPYDDKAWGKMQVLLDEHLPQKKGSKKPIIFLLIFLMLGAIVFYTVKNDKSKTIAKNIIQKKADNTTENGLVNIKDNKPDSANTDNVIKDKLVIQPTDLSEHVPYIAKTKKNQQKNARLLLNNTGIEKQKIKKGKRSFSQKDRFAVKIKKPAMARDEDNNIPSQMIKKPDVDEDYTALTGGIKKMKSLPDETNNDLEKEKKITNTKTDSLNTVVQETGKVADSKIKNTSSHDKNKKDRSFASNFAFTFSVGEDVSFIELSNTGKLKPIFGSGLRYNLGKHVAISSGFYFSKKIYSAQPTQYKFSAGSYYPNLIKIDADCKIYEIPVNVYYNFKRVKNHNWFGGMGLSSFLMKKESYDYIYKMPSGQQYNYLKTVSNENEHYFSVFTISGGYQYILNKRLSFIAEPYLKVPLGGVGLGKIKLNSTGLLFTAAVKPF